MAPTNVDNSIYEKYGERWYTAYDDPIALLRAESKVKTPWILERIKRFQDTNATVLDVGCGAGFLSNQLAQSGLNVTGVDFSGESLRVAKLYDKTNSVTYKEADAYHLPFPDASFDVVTAMDFLEHVEDPKAIIREISRVLKPGGQFFFHTFNRNLIGYFVVIKLVEWLVKNTPKHMHILRLFIKPQELSSYNEQASMKTIELTGIRPVFSSIPLKNLFSGVVPRELRFTLTKSLMLSYLGMAIKET